MTEILKKFKNKQTNKTAAGKSRKLNSPGRSTGNGFIFKYRLSCKFPFLKIIVVFLIKGQTSVDLLFFPDNGGVQEIRPDPPVVGVDGGSE